MTSYGITVIRGRINEIAGVAVKAERNGYDTVWSPEFYTRSAVVTLAQIASTTIKARIGSCHAALHAAVTHATPR